MARTLDAEDINTHNTVAAITELCSPSLPCNLSHLDVLTHESSEACHMQLYRWHNVSALPWGVLPTDPWKSSYALVK